MRCSFNEKKMDKVERALDASKDLHQVLRWFSCLGENRNFMFL